MLASQQQRAMQAGVQGSAPIVSLNGNLTVPALYTDYLPSELMGAPRDFFVYGVDFLSIAAGATGTETFTVQNDSDFLIVAVNGTAVDPTDEQVAFVTSALTIQFTDSGSGRQLQNRAQSFDNVVGTAQLPAYFPFPKFVDRASDFTTTIANNAGAAAVRVRLSFLGFKIFPKGFTSQ